jgi:hypothetical protein
MWNKTITIVLLLILLTGLAGCNLPTGPVDSTPTTPTTDAVATKVAQLLTVAPTFTQPAPTSEPSSSPAPATATVEPTATNTQAAPAQNAPTATPTFSSSDPKSSLGAPTWRNTLDSGKAFYQYENDNTRVVMENGALALTGLSANGWLGWSLTFSQPSQNFYLEATFSPQTCSGADLYGLVFRAPSAEAGYFFGVTCDGRYNLHARNFNDGTDKSLIQLTANGAILAGSNQVNRIGIRADGDKIGLYANGTLLQEVTDSTFTKEGSFGAQVAANDTAGFTVKMDEISLWKLP